MEPAPLWTQNGGPWGKLEEREFGAQGHWPVKHVRLSWKQLESVVPCDSDSNKNSDPGRLILGRVSQRRHCEDGRVRIFFQKA